MEILIMGQPLIRPKLWCFLSPKANRGKNYSSLPFFPFLVHSLCDIHQFLSELYLSQCVINPQKFWVPWGRESCLIHLCLDLPQNLDPITETGWLHTDTTDLSKFGELPWKPHHCFLLDGMMVGQLVGWSRLVWGRRRDLGKLIIH